ncbi:DNA adenine methylase [Chromobacterium haemolyticum]|uniref:DNA adenine methylase n=1 Tax=Chromobacterium haemolyticum TaxID=394935 RepID=UPI000DEF5CEB|nr:DNA adenine methylase [Chromobacterium haemolyticum]
MSGATRPVLRYHGGKFRLAPWIMEFFPAHRVYVEPFGGGGSVLIRKPRSHAEVYNDLDTEIVNLFAVLRDDGHRLREQLELTPFAREEFDLSYQPCTDPVEQARRTVVRSFMGFGSAAASGKKTGFRANSNRSHTTPALDWRNYPAALPYLIDRLRGGIIENRQAAEVIGQHDSESTLIYADPPYVLSTRGRMETEVAYGQYTGYRYEMTDNQHRDLASVLHSAKGMVVLSGYACDLYDKELYQGWERHERQALADGARERTEVIWINPACSEALHGAGLFSGVAA